MSRDRDFEERSFMAMLHLLLLRPTQPVRTLAEDAVEMVEALEEAVARRRARGGQAAPGIKRRAV